MKSTLYLVLTYYFLHQKIMKKKTKQNKTKP